MSHRRDPAWTEAIVWTATEEATVCFAHSGTPSDALHVQAEVGGDAAEAFTALAEADGHRSWTAEPLTDRGGRRWTTSSR